MKRALVLALACTGCMSDLAVGMTLRRIDDQDGGPELDAGRPSLDARVLDARTAPPAHDASTDAGDGGPQWEECAIGFCIAQIAGPDLCAPGEELVCARPYPDQSCEFACLVR
jgi:hypothetical protein